MHPSIVLTEAASVYIKKMIEKKQGIGFRLSIKKTGCSGFTYFPEVVNSVNQQDILLLQTDIKIFIDPLWVSLLSDMTIDLTEEDKSGLKQKKLVFVNTKESGRCGCGESFHIE